MKYFCSVAFLLLHHQTVIHRWQICLTLPTSSNSFYLVESFGARRERARLARINRGIIIRAPQPPCGCSWGVWILKAGCTGGRDVVFWLQMKWQMLCVFLVIIFLNPPCLPRKKDDPLLCIKSTLSASCQSLVPLRVVFWMYSTHAQRWGSRTGLPKEPEENEETYRGARRWLILALNAVG